MSSSPSLLGVAWRHVHMHLVHRSWRNACISFALLLLSVLDEKQTAEEGNRVSQVCYLWNIPISKNAVFDSSPPSWWESWNDLPKEFRSILLSWIGTGCQNWILKKVRKTTSLRIHCFFSIQRTSVLLRHCHPSGSWYILLGCGCYRKLFAYNCAIKSMTQATYKCV